MDIMANTPVLIVGAGPTGLMLAIELARRAVPFRLIDRNPAPLGWDRATVVKSRTLEIMDTLGIADKFLEYGRKVTSVDLYSFGERVASVSFKNLDSRFPFILGQPESATEYILTAELERLGGSVERAKELTGLEQGSDSVRARVQSSVQGREEVIVADWVVGTDGLHSAVRQAVGDKFEGHDNPMLWAVVDARLDGWRHSDNHIAAQLQKPSANPIPLADGRWRIYFRPESRDLTELSRVEAGIAEMSPGASFGEHDEPRFFHTNSRVAHNYRVGRVFVAGDAAHACSPIQGHGMNSGIQDAHNLGWKLALCVKGEAADGLLDTYETERQPIGRLVVATSDEAEANFVSQDPESRRHMIAELAREADNRRAAINEAEIAHSYDHSPIIDRTDMSGDGVTMPGYRVGDVHDLVADRGHTRLYELLRVPRHVLFVLLGKTDASGVADGRSIAARALGKFASRLQIVLVVKNGTGVDVLAQDVIHDQSGDLHRRLGAAHGTALSIVRPDGYLALCSSPPDPNAVQKFLKRVFS
jgi:2-polyprenyl-6-methoxyphenol hydroxylase-like FAD-dependent oxidoreductase